MVGPDSWQRCVPLPVFITGGRLGPRLRQMPGMVEAPAVPLLTPPGKSQGTGFGARSQEGSAPPTAVDGAEGGFGPALGALEYSSSLLGVCAGGSKRGSKRGSPSAL